VDGGRVPSRVPMHVAGRHARLRADHREHAPAPRFLRRICFRVEPPGPAERAMSEGV